jgi:NAD(P)-dependent dehydrogenase (short-subunit alcohol dehydrogenase family)
MSTLTASNTKTERISFSRLLWVGPVAAVVAAIANLIVFLASPAARNITGETLKVNGGWSW